MEMSRLCTATVAAAAGQGLLRREDPLTGMLMGCLPRAHPA